ncbi:MAG: (5-formylfuran-3-yl)methyl phosphate synthase [Gammaproteobacteria bacterium]|nr:(5-formylfuran-3-yl)methyl phosphate synthase [Gammaproteobacteria bacterium]
MIPFNTRFLASVSTPEEADLVGRHGADIVDLKDPAAGALGAVDITQIARIVMQQRTRYPHRLISATIGDVPLQPPVVSEAIRVTAATGVDIVKIGWFATSFDSNMLPVLQEAAGRDIRLVVVLFAEYGMQSAYLPALAAAGVHGVMLDTADKAGGSLRDRLADAELADFLESARRHGLVCGLAGSLRRSDIPPLLELEPDYLGFRGALCRHSERTAGLDGAAVESVRLLIKSRGITRAHAS